MPQWQRGRLDVMTTNLVPLIDADIIVYRCGFAIKDEEPLEYALHTVKVVVDTIREKFYDAPTSKLYLTGSGNYRNTVAVTRPYKGNRDKLNKPFYYEQIRDYLRDVQGAILVDDMEADDALGMEQWKHKDKSTVICSIDKDLRCIPGWHYNFVKDELDYVTLADANKNFWRQVIMGDPTDNIQGLPRYGAKAASKIIDSTDGTWTDMYARVLREYEAVYGDEGHAKFREMASLVWILREPFKNFDGTDVFNEEQSGEEEDHEEEEGNGEDASLRAVPGVDGSEIL